MQVTVGDPVIIADWGGPTELRGRVIRVDPFGITRYSALGVEEQRVNAVIAFSSPPEDYSGLGHGFRVETQIIVWEAENTLIVPASALFHSRDRWAVFVVVNGNAQHRHWNSLGATWWRCMRCDLKTILNESRSREKSAKEREAHWQSGEGPRGAWAPATRAPYKQ